MPPRSEDRHDAKRIAQQLGGRLRGLRVGMRWTQEQVSERIGLTSEAYARIERGYSLPSFPTFVKLCEAVGTRPDVLLNRDTDLPEEVGDAATYLPPDRVAWLLADIERAQPRLAQDVARLVQDMHRVVSNQAPAERVRRKD